MNLNVGQASRLPSAAGASPFGRFAAGAGGTPALLCSRAGQRAFSLLEIMVAVALLALIIVGLLAMFYQVQRAFRSGTAQVDVMEGGRAATSMIVREAQEAAATQLDGVTNMAVVPPMKNAANTVAVADSFAQSLPGGETRQNFLRDFFFISKVNDEWVGTAYRISNAVSGVGTLYRFVEKTNLANLAPLVNKLATSNPYMNPKDCRRVMDGVVHFTVDFYETNGVFFTNNSDPTYILYSATNEMLPAYLEVQLAVLEPVPLEKFRYRYDANPVQAGTYLANQAARTHVFRQRVPIRPAPADYGQ
ncbi:MAG TPA: prepilin-type N-terminal cleavage/methylation domain-containing protein [Verrucomicrobiae bacterium]|nr:prepilin-type N-terminal cleavage/methylation domain-containing protein [Verrucomicrobiae bacterium]